MDFMGFFYFQFDRYNFPLAHKVANIKYNIEEKDRILKLLQAFLSPVIYFAGSELL